MENKLKLLVGLTEKDAIKLIRDSGYEHRILEEDERFVGDCQYDTHRINLYIKKGLVYRATIG